MQKNIEVFLIRATVEMFDCGEPDRWSRLALDHFHRDLLGQQCSFMKLALDKGAREPCVASECPARAPAVTDQQHSSPIGVNAVTNGENSMAAAFGVRRPIQNPAGSVGAIEGIGNDETEDNRAALVEHHND